MLPVLAAASLLLISSPFKDAKKHHSGNTGAPGEILECRRGPCCLDVGSFKELLGPIEWEQRAMSLKTRERFTVPPQHVVRLCS